MEIKNNSMILIRTSTKDQAPKLQLKECMEYNKEHNWNCVKVFEKQESAYKNEKGVWKEEVEWGIKNNVGHIIVWNMDRFSRLPEEKVLIQVEVMSEIHNLQIHAVHGDLWSEIVESMGKLSEMGFLGEAIREFVKKLLRGLEFQRSNRESKTKSERVKLAVRKEEGKKTKSYKGNNWGRKPMHTNKIKRILELRKDGMNYRDIAAKENVSIGKISEILSVHKSIPENEGGKPIEN